MSLELDEVYEAKYKEAVFILNSARTSGGQKDILHLFPNSRRQSIENLGRKQRSFIIEGSIFGPDYLRKRDILLSALEEENVSGTFTHPFYGDIENVIARTFTINETFANLGEARLTINFEINTDAAQPKEADLTSGQIESLNNTVRDSIKNDIENNIKITDSFTQSYEKSRDKLENFIQSFDESTKSMNDVTSTFNELSSDISEFSSTIVQLLKAPTDLADSIDNLFSTANAAVQIIEKTIEGFENLFDFGSDDPDEININTSANNEQIKNIKTINSATNVLALSWSYLAVSKTSFRTEDEVNTERAILEEQFQKILLNEVDSKNSIFNIDSILSNDSIKAINDIRTLANNFLEEIKKDAARTISIETQETSSRLLSFNYYGDSNNYEEINRINEFSDINFIKNEVSVISDTN